MIIAVSIGVGSKSLNPFFNLFFSPVSSPAVFSASVLNSAIDSIGELNSVRKERNTLMSENALLQAENSVVLLMREEIESLRKELNMPPDERFATVEVQILSNQDEEVSNFLVVNKGSKSGLKTGDTARIGNVYIGRVVDVSRDRAKIELPTNARSSLQVEVIPRSDDITNMEIDQISPLSAYSEKTIWKGVVTGSSNSIQIENIEKNATVKQGDHIIITDASISRILYLGDLTDISEGASDIDIQGKVVTPVNYQNLTNLMIDKKIE